jgi:hypothetical protein
MGISLIFAGRPASVQRRRGGRRVHAGAGRGLPREATFKHYTSETLVRVRGSQFWQPMVAKMFEGVAIAHLTLDSLTGGCPLFETFRKELERCLKGD